MDFAGALTRSPAIVAEIKKASPVAGTISLEGYCVRGCLCYMVKEEATALSMPWPRGQLLILMDFEPTDDREEFLQHDPQKEDKSPGLTSFLSLNGSPDPTPRPGLPVLKP